MATYKVYFSNNGVPQAGLTPTWTTLKRVSDGVNQTQPSITEIGGGWYKFDHVVPEGEQHVGVIDGGATLTIDPDRYVPIDMHPNDFDLDAHEEVFVSPVYDENSDSLTFATFFLRDGKIITTGITSVTVNVYNSSHVLQFTLNALSGTNGLYMLTQSAPGLVKNEIYYVIATFVTAQGNFDSADTFIALE